MFRGTVECPLSSFVNDTIALSLYAIALLTDSDGPHVTTNTAARTRLELPEQYHKIAETFCCVTMG